MQWQTSIRGKRRAGPPRDKALARGCRTRWSAEFQVLEDRTLLSAGQDLVNQLQPYQTALTTAINTAASLPLIGDQFKGLQQFNTILQDSLSSIESQTQNLTNGHFQLAIPLPSIAQTFQFDLGLDNFLDFSTAGGVAVAINPVLNVGFDYQNGSATLDTSQTNLDLGFNVSLPNFQATLSFNHLLYAQAVDEGTNFGAHLDFGFDSDGSIASHFSGDAHVLLGLTMSFVDPALQAPFNPTFKTDLDLDWSIDTQSNQLNAPTIKLKNFSLDVSSFVHGFLGDVITTVQKYTEPLEPFIDTFDTPVPVLSAFDGNETIGDMLLQGAGFSQDQQDRFHLMVRVIKAVNTIDLSGSTDSGLLDFGDISLTGDARNANGFNFDTSQITGVVGDVFNNPAFKDIQNTLVSVADYTGLVSTGGMQFPLLDDPAPVITGLLTGQAKDMFTFSTGREHFELPASIGFGIPKVLGVFLSAGIVFDADLTMGYDTSGLIKFVQDPNKNPEDLLHGFYFDNAVDTTDPPVPDVASPRNTALYLHGFAELEGSVGITFSGGLYADLSFELADPNPGAASSHVYLDDMIANLASNAKVIKATGKFYAAASIELTIPDPIGPDITLFKYELAHYDIINNDPPPPPNLGVPVVVIDSTTQHTLSLDVTKMAPGAAVTVEPFYGLTIGNDVADGIRVDYPGEVDLYVERKDSVNTDYYNFIGLSGTVPNGVSIDINDPFRVFSDTGAPNPAPTQTKPGVLLAGGTDVTYQYNEAFDGSHAAVLLAGGYGYSTLVGGTMEFGNFIPVDRVGDAESQFGDTSGYDAAGQALLNSEIQAAVAPADPTGIIGTTMTASHGGLMLGGPGNDSFIAAGPGVYDMIGGPWVNSFTISPSFGGAPASYTIDGGGGQSVLNVRVPTGDTADFEGGTDPDKYNPQDVVLDIYSNAGLFATAQGISTVVAYAAPGSNVVVGDTSELDIAFTLKGSGNFTFGGSPGPDTFAVSASYVYYGTAHRHYTAAMFNILTALGSPNGPLPDYSHDFDNNLANMQIDEPGQRPTGAPGDYFYAEDQVLLDPPVFTIDRTFGTNGHFQSIELEATDPLKSPITLDGRGGSDTYNVALGLGTFSDIHVADSDATTRNSLVITPNLHDLIFDQATMTANAVNFAYYTPLVDFLFNDGSRWVHSYNASVAYSPSVTFSANVDPTLAGGGSINHVIIDRPDADPSQTATVQLQGAVGSGIDYIYDSAAYDPEQANPQYVAFPPNSPPDFEVTANSGNLEFSENRAYPIPATFNVHANSGDVSFNFVHGWDGLAETINILSNDGTVTDTNDINALIGYGPDPDSILNIFANTGSISTQTTGNPQIQNGIDTQVNIGLGSLDNVHGTINLSSSYGPYGLSIDDRTGTSTGRSESIDDSATRIGDLTINYAGANAPSGYDGSSVYSAWLRSGNPLSLGLYEPPFFFRYLNGGSFNTWGIYSGETAYQDGDSVNEQVQLFGDPGGTVTYSATGLPPGVSIDPATGHISGTIPLQSSRPGSAPYLSTLSATANGLQHSALFEWFILSAITIDSPFFGTTQGYEGLGLSGGPITATNRYNRPVTLSVTGLPPGLSFDPDTGTITGTIDVGAAQSGPYQVDIHATDGQETADLPFQLNVTGIQFAGPTVQVSYVGDSVDLALSATTASGAPVTIDAQNLPDGLSFDPATGLVSGTISALAGTTGTYYSTITLTDRNDVQQVQIQWSIIPAGVADYVSLGDIGKQTNQDGDGIDIGPIANDTLGLPLSYTATGLPPGLSLVDGVILGTIAANADTASPYHVHVTATDGRWSADDSFDWNVIPASTVALTDPFGQVSYVDQPQDTFLTATSSLNEPITYSATGLPPGLSLNPQTGEITGTIPLQAASPSIFHVTATATAASGSDTKTFLWSVYSNFANNVVTLPNPEGGSPFTVTSPAGTILSASISPRSDAAPPAGIDFPFGFLSFVVINTAQPGQPVDVTISGLDFSKITDYYKYGATPADASSHWYDFLFGQPTDADSASGTGMEIVNGNLVLHLVDGGRGDDDVSPNGYIFDIGGPAEAATAGPATPTLLVSDSGGTYRGSPFSATATATDINDNPVNGAFTFTYYVGSSASGTASSTAPTNAGTYTVLAHFTSSDPNFTDADSQPVTFVIGQATPAITLSAIGGAYQGSPYPATGAVAGVVSGVDDTPSSSLEGVPLTLGYYAGSTASGSPLSGAPTAAGTYTVVASFAGSQDYRSASTSTTFTIGQATPTLTVTAAGGTYNRNSFPATGSVAGVSGMADSTLEGVGLTFTYYAGTTASGSPLSAAPSDAGTYTVVASFAGSQDYRSVSTSTTFTIGQATPTVTVTAVGGTYNGNPFPATGSAAGVSGMADSTLEGVGLTFTYYAGTTAGGPPLPAAPGDAGTYTVVASFAGSQDYGSASTSTTFTIGQAAPTVTVTDAGGMYNGNSFPATGSVAGVGGMADSTLEGVGLTFTYYAGTAASGPPLPAAPSDAGTYTVVASFAGSQDYGSASTSTTFTIGQATPTVTVTDAGGTYNGNPFPATGSATGVAGAAVSGTFAFAYYVGSGVGGAGSSTAPKNPGTYTVAATFTSSDPDYGNTQSAPVTFTISPAPPSDRLGLWLLDPTGSGALTVSGSGSVIVNGDGAVVVDSSSATAALLSGRGSLIASVIDVTGGTKATGSGRFVGTVDHEAPIPDPLGLLLPPAPSTTFAAVNYSGRTTLTLSPGTFVGGIKVSGSGSVVLLPGVYYLKGGGLAVTGSGSISGTGVLIINDPNVSTDGIRLSGSGSASFTPSSSLTGAYAAYNGITILQDPSSSVPISLTGSGRLSLAGVLYAPKAPVVQSGSGGLAVETDATYGRAQVIVADLRNTGSGSVTVDPARPTATLKAPVPRSVPGEPVPFVIYASGSFAKERAAKFTFTISFGDGDSRTLTSPGPLLVNHVFSQPGMYVVQVTATDEFGNTSAVAKQTIVVASAAVGTDLVSRTQTARFVGGTPGNDSISFAPSGRSSSAVTLGGKSAGTSTTSGPRIVFGQGGPDTIQESPALKTWSLLRKRPANPVLPRRLSWLVDSIPPTR